MPSPFTWYVNYYSTINNEEAVGIFFALQTDGRTDRQTDEPTFLKSLRYADSNGMHHSVNAWINTDRQQNNMFPQ